MPKTLVLSILVHFGTLGMRRGVFEPRERGSLDRIRTFTQLAEIQRNTSVFKYLDHAGRRNLMKLPVPQIVPHRFLGYGFIEVLAPLGFRESFARLRRIA